MARVPGSAVFVLLLSLVAAAGRADEPPKAVVLTYHVVQSPNDTVYSMTRESFRRQMEYLRATGYTVISLADLHDYVTGKRESIPDPSVVITVDDGWKCVYTEMFPVMQELGFPFTVFIYPKFIGQSAYALSWKDVRTMADAGVDIQSHSYSHSFLTRRSGANLRAELVESKAAIEKNTGKSVRFIAYPYGDYNDRVVKATKAAGYDAGLTCNFGPVVPGSNPFEMKRVVLYQKTTFAAFRRLLGTEELQLAQVSPQAGGEFDPDEPVVAAKIADFEDLVPESVNLSILGLRRAPSYYDPRNGSISLVLRDATAGRKYRAAVWTFTLPQGDREIVAARRAGATHRSGGGAVAAASMSGQR